MVVPEPAAESAEAAARPAAAEPRWGRYNARTMGRGPRPMLLAACGLLGPGEGRTAVDLGCGAGVDSLALLARGWSVTAIDNDPAGLDLLTARIPAESAGQIRIVRAAFSEAVLPRVDLVHAGYSLPFSPAGQFAELWAGIRHALQPGGVFAGQLFGIRDSWADTARMSFHNPEQVAELLEGLEVLQLDETEWDGDAMSGPKHWHVYDIMVRRIA